MKIYMTWFLKNEKYGTLPRECTEIYQYMFNQVNVFSNFIRPLGKTHILFSSSGRIIHTAIFKLQKYNKHNKVLDESIPSPIISTDIDCTYPQAVVTTRIQRFMEFINYDALNVNLYEKEQRKFIKRMSIALKYVRSQFTNLDDRIRQIIRRHHLRMF